MELADIEQLIDHKDFGILDFDDLVRVNAFAIEKYKEIPLPTMDYVWNERESVTSNQQETRRVIKRRREIRTEKKEQKRKLKKLEREAMIKAFSTDYQLSNKKVTHAYNFADREGGIYGTDEVRYLLHEVLNTFHETKSLTGKEEYKGYIVSEEVKDIKELKDLVDKVNNPTFCIHTLDRFMRKKEFNLETFVEKILPMKRHIWDTDKSVKWNKERTQQVTKEIQDRYLNTGILKQELNILQEKAIIQAFAFDHGLSCEQMEIAYKFAYREGIDIHIGEVLRILMDYLSLHRTLR